MSDNRIYLLAGSETPELAKLRQVILSLGYALEGPFSHPDALLNRDAGLVLVDSHTQSKDARGIPCCAPSLAGPHQVVLVQAQEGAVDESTALQHGIVGVFYRSLPADILLKGLRCILSGEYWFNRQVTSQVIAKLLKGSKSARHQVDLTGAKAAKLTDREKHVTERVYQGASNDEIAEQLCISVHTVKTHLYSVFRKTGCRNRLELINWARQANNGNA